MEGMLNLRIPVEFAAKFKLEGAPLPEPADLDSSWPKDVGIPSTVA